MMRSPAKQRMPFREGHFICSALQKEHFPIINDLRGNPLPEIALVGRSNVGKSSLINFLLNQPQLAKISSTPGKTRSLNFFLIDQEMLLVDLPGYGYAEVPKHLRSQWSEHLEQYFTYRKSLKLILLLLDIRRTPNDMDLAMTQWSMEKEKPTLVVFTKCDQLSSHEVQSHIISSMRALDGCNIYSYVTTSIRDQRTRKQLIGAIHSVYDCTQ
jgi:GTP-binding protein